MQGSKTLDFWNRLHDQNSTEESVEWIAHPESSLLDTLASHLPATAPRVLEIGCGTSSLSKCLFEHIRNDEADFCVTDVSPVCIEHNALRDSEFVTKHGSRFRYRVWNILQDITPDEETSFDVILDKGCLDTFLFRSETKIQSSLISTFLRFVVKWTTQKYLVMTPRAKLPPLLRDYPGFSTVTRHAFTEGLGDLEGDHHQRRKQQAKVYLHVCTINPSYQPPTSDEATIVSNKYATTVCSQCGISLKDFLVELNPSLSEAKKFRQWRGHQIHCRPAQKDNVVCKK